MPRPKKAPRLWLRPERRNALGIVTHKSSYVVLDEQKHTATGCSPNERSGAEAALADYVAHKYAKSRSARNPNIIPIADVLSTYQINVAPTTSNPPALLAHITRLRDGRH